MKRKIIHLVSIVAKWITLHLDVGRVNAIFIKCNQMGHETVICKSKNQQQEEEAKVVNQEEKEKDQLFMTTCSVSSTDSENWLIDSGWLYQSYDK